MAHATRGSRMEPPPPEGHNVEGFHKNFLKIIIPKETCIRNFLPKRVSKYVVTKVITIVIIPTTTVPILGFSIPAASNMIVE